MELTPPIFPRLSLCDAGLKGTVERLPGFGSLFVVRDFRLHVLHKSLTEWLTDAGAGAGLLGIRAGAGHARWAALLGPLTFHRRGAGAGGAAAPGDYGLRCALHHLVCAAALAESGGDTGGKGCDDGAAAAAARAWAVRAAPLAAPPPLAPWLSPGPGMRSQNQCAFRSAFPPETRHSNRLWPTGSRSCDP